MTSVAVIGASGYVGGELLRLLLTHPSVKKLQVTSQSYKGKHVGAIHPNLRGITDLEFIDLESVEPCDIIFLAMPHGRSSADTTVWYGKASITIDLSADFRVQDLDAYQRYYKHAHPCPDLLRKFSQGLPEFNRASLTTADYIAVPGCTALTTILALKPLSDAGLIKSHVFVDSKVGSSGSGAHPTPASHHATRSGVTRVFKATGHRHEAEVAATCNNAQAHITVTSIEAVRGILVAAYAELDRPVDERALRALYREAYETEPFTRIVKRRGGSYRLPEPKLLSGTNFCDVGFELTADGRCIIAFAALDNLMKGAAGNAVHCMNIRLGLDEKTSLGTVSLHPI